MDTIQGSVAGTIASGRPPTAWQFIILRAILFALIVPMLSPLNPQWSFASIYSLAVAAIYILFWPVMVIATVTFCLALLPARGYFRHRKSGTIRNAVPGSIAGGLAGVVAVLSGLLFLYGVPSSVGSTKSEVFVWFGQLFACALVVGAISGALATGPSARWVGAIVLSIYVALFGAFKIYERDFRLAHIPDGMGVTKVLYSKEESWGFPFFPLPGDNETGVIVYELPASTASQIGKAGIEYFSKLPSKAGSGANWQGRYEEWRQTPLSGKDWVADPISGAISSQPKLGIFLNKYGFAVDLDPEIERLIDEAIAAPGSYFAYGRSGVLIVIPNQRRVVYAYAG